MVLAISKNEDIKNTPTGGGIRYSTLAHLPALRGDVVHSAVCAVLVTSHSVLLDVVQGDGRHQLAYNHGGRKRRDS